MIALIKKFKNKPKKGPIRLHVGCGQIYFEGWINIDIDSEKADKKWDLKKTLPYKENSVDMIYNEHVIEHFTSKQGVRILADFYRILKPGGILRIATPDLDHLIDKYCSTNWADQAWMHNGPYQWIKTRAEMLNVGFREWGHLYLYNAEELERRLLEAGFTNVTKEELYQSEYDELRNRESREDSKLIMEAIKK